MDKNRTEHLMDVSLTVSAELGRCTMRIREILELGVGSLLTLNRAATDPVDLLVNEKVVARGEIVAVNECFGVHITELVRLTDGVG